MLSALEAAAVEALLTEAPVEVDVDRASARTIVRVVFAALDVEGRLARIAQLERLAAVLYDAASTPAPQASPPGWPTSAGAGSPVTTGGAGEAPHWDQDRGPHVRRSPDSCRRPGVIVGGYRAGPPSTSPLGRPTGVKGWWEEVGQLGGPHPSRLRLL